jgi:signal transduction histidine kinase
VAALQLFVTPFWWERTFVRLAGLLGLVTLLAAGMARRERVQRLRAEELSRAVADRTEDMVRYTRALSDHLAVLNRDLEHRRLQEKRQSDLLLRLAHDVRSPLTSLLGFSELLASSASSRLTARELRYLTNLTESAKQVLRLADDLLLEAELAAKGRSLQVEAVEVESLLGGVVSLLEGLAVSREISVRLEVAPNLPLVRTDLVLLRQVLLNLVSNAIKFSPNRAVVEVVADPDPASKGFWRIEVRDRGPGIPASEKKAVFDRFWRSPAAGGVPGHGLGLTIARELTERLGGQVEIEDRPGGGTILRLRLPLELSTESGQSPLAVEPAPSTSRVVVFDPSAERFFRWVPALDRAGFLAVRTDDVEVLRQRLCELSPLAVVWVANPREPNLWALLEPAARDLSRRNLPFVHVVGEPRGERGFVLPWDRIFPPGTTREAIERALASPLDKVTLVGQQELELLTLSELESRLETTGSLRCLLLPDESLARQRERWWEEVAQAPEGLPTRLLQVLESFRRRAVAQNAKRGGISP